MRQRTIESQTTRPCCKQPRPSDYEVRLREQLWVNFIDTLKLFGFLGSGLVVYMAIVAIVQWFWGQA